MPTISFEKALEIALEQHQSGHFERAEGLYLEILRQDPGNVDAIHLLGVLAHQGKQSETAVRLISSAIRKRPDVAVFHYNLAEAHIALKQLEDAIAAYRSAVEMKPDYFEAHNNLGMALNTLRRFSEGESACRRALELNPTAAAPHNNFGNSLRGLGRSEEAAEAYRRALALRPDFVEATSNLAMCLCSMGKLDDGVAIFRKAIALSPANADLHNNLGTALVALGRWEDAGESFQTAIDISPEHAEALNNLGAVLRNLSKSDKAAEFFSSAVKLRPEFAEAQSNLAATLAEIGRKAEALEAVDRALELRPNAAKEHFLRGLILRDLGRHDDAITELRRTLELEPNSYGALAALGYAHEERGELDEALDVLNRSIQLNPDPQTHSNVLLAASYHPGYSPQQFLDIHRTWAEIHETPHIPQWPIHANDRSPSRRLRLGYVSPDFRGHSVATFLEPILEHHDHDQFEVFGYAHIVQTDVHTWRLRASIDQWRETAGRTPQQVADQIIEDKIDILVELAGHTGNNSLTVFARKPAPVQINMIGFPATTGLSAIDYRITDERCDPSGISDQFNTEKLVRLPHVFWAYQPPHAAPEIASLPADKANGRITFASVNNFTKVTPHVQELWAKLMKAVPNSRLILQASALSSEFTRRTITERFAAAGVPADRFEFREAIAFNQFLKFVTSECDMTLDPFPFNGGTTTCHSLWMGAPVITLAGDRHASRMGLSMMTDIGLPEFVAYTPEQYVEIGVKMANDLPRLREIRAGMRDRLKASHLLDGAGYTRDLEHAFRSVWKKWCENPS